jgi:hypothetical protein
MRFAGCTLRQKKMRVAFIARSPVRSPRIQRIEAYGLSSYGHFLDIVSLEQLDDELRGWLCAAYRVGCQIPDAPE